MSLKSLIYPPLMHHHTSNVFSPMEIEKIIDTTLTKDSCRFYKVKWIRISWESENDLTYFNNSINEFWSQYTNESLLLDNTTDSFETSRVVPSSKRIEDDSPTKYDLPQPFTEPALIPYHSKDINFHTNNTQTFKEHLEKVLNETNTSPSISPSENLSRLKFDDNVAKNKQDKGYLKLNPSVSEEDLNHPVKKMIAHAKLKNPLIDDMEYNKQIMVEKKFTCSKCSKCFANEFKYNIHSESHNLKICSVCNKEFTRIAHLNAHLLIHKNERLFICKECDKGFNDKSTLKKHEVLHSGIRNFKCETCKKSFQRKQHLKRHQDAVHSNIRKHCCRICNKSFHEKAGLLSHVNTHTGDKPFTCSLCNKGFADKSTLSKHKSCHIKEKLFNCVSCDKKFTRAATLNVHLKKHCDSDVNT